MVALFVLPPREHEEDIHNNQPRDTFAPIENSASKMEQILDENLRLRRRCEALESVNAENSHLMKEIGTLQQELIQSRKKLKEYEVYKTDKVRIDCHYQIYTVNNTDIL